MNLIDKIRHYGSTYILNKKIAGNNRTRKLINIDSAGSVGILFALTDESVYYSIQKYLQKLQGKKVRVKALGFVDNKAMQEHFLPVLAFDFINLKQVSWFNIPKAQSVEDFVATDFDICINLAAENVFPLKYIAGLSRSKLKVGGYFQELSDSKFRELGKIYDIMILMEEGHNQADFLNHVHEYLTILNPKTNV